ncbi:MAG: zinc-dependent peptidase [Sulfurimonadaceae bacterium]|nr:zinc-dependent peptidase [Sulfurimonadaceae bacterium]
MSYHAALIWLFGALFLLYTVYLLWRYLRKRRLEHFLATTPFPEAYRVYLRKTVHYNLLSDDEREQIERAVLRFVHTKRFEGIGLDVTDEMKTVVAFYACLMLLHKPGDWFANLSTVILYAEGFVANRTVDNGGIVTSGAFDLDGESSEDTVVLSWDDALTEAYRRYPQNLIIHEFAHILDFYNGYADGTPAMASEDIHALHHAYDRFLERIESETFNGDYGIFGDYAAEHEAEFFAVSSERFFQTPQNLHRAAPKLYGLLSRFYGVDPLRWDVEGRSEDMIKYS